MLSRVLKLDRLTGLACRESLCVLSGMLIFSAALRSGSLSLSGAGASEALLMPPPPINVCIASTAGLGLVCRASSAAFCCFRLFNSAIAARPVSDIGDVPGERPGLSDLGEMSAVLRWSLYDLFGRSRFGFSPTALGAGAPEPPGSDVGVRGPASSGRKCSACGVEAREVVAAICLSVHLFLDCK